jgi:hypothetical protein
MAKHNGAAALQLSGPATPDPEPEKIAKPESVSIPIVLLMAAESVSGGESGSCIFLHARNGAGRVVSASPERNRLFLASFDLPTKNEGGCPAWLNAGIKVDTEDLKPKLGLLKTLASAETSVRITYATGGVYAELSNSTQSVTFRLSLVDGAFGNYDVLFEGAFTSNASDRDWQAVGFNSTYLKQCADIAKVLESGLDKSQRSPGGMVIRAFNGGEKNKPQVFDFPTWPGALLLIPPAEFPSPAISKPVTSLLAPAIRASISALTAHATRNRAWGDEQTDPAAKAAFYQKAVVFDQRVAALRMKLPGFAIAAPTPAPEPAPDPEAEAARQAAEAAAQASYAAAQAAEARQAEADAAAAAPDPEPEPVPEPETAAPATRRTKIKVKGSDNSASA